MKKYLFLIMAALLTANLYGQNAIKFLGIPVDGFKQDMITALKAKGYKYDSDDDALVGEFNGRNVNIYVKTVNNKVWRIAIIDSEMTRDEANIRIRYNNLLSQLSSNAKYTKIEGSAIPESEKISYEMLVHKKRYDGTLANVRG